MFCALRVSVICVLLGVPAEAASIVPGLSSALYGDLAGHSDYEVNLRPPEESVKEIEGSLDAIMTSEDGKSKVSQADLASAKAQMMEAEKIAIQKIVASAFPPSFAEAGTQPNIWQQAESILKADCGEACLKVRSILRGHGCRAPAVMGRCCAICKPPQIIPWGTRPRMCARDCFDLCGNVQPRVSQGMRALEMLAKRALQQVVATARVTVTRARESRQSRASVPTLRPRQFNGRTRPSGLRSRLFSRGGTRKFL